MAQERSYTRQVDAAKPLDWVSVGGALGEVVSAFAKLVQQSRILNGDDRLSGEVLNQFDLLFGEGPRTAVPPDDIWRLLQQVRVP